MAVLSPVAKQQFFDNDGNPASGFLLYTYATGTSTPLATYSDEEGVTANANPIVLDARGEAIVYIPEGTAYDYVLKTSVGATVWTRNKVSYPASGGNFVQPASGALTRTMQAKAEEIISAADFAGLDKTGATASTTALTAALAASAGRSMLIPKGTYLTDRLIPAANTTIYIEPGTVINAINAGTRVFQIQVANVHIWAYGVQSVMDGTQNSHNVQIVHPAENCSVRGLHAIGSGSSGDDCFYIGGDPATNSLPKNIHLIDCIGQGLGAGTRNGLSVVACDGYVIEGCKFFNSLGAPGAGIDLEANLYCADGTSALKRGILRRNKCYGNLTGIAGVFFDDCVAEDNEVYNNTNDGIATAVGGTQFNVGIYRPGDALGVNSFNLATGEITVLATGKLLTTDYGIGPGTIISKRTRSGGTWPAELAAASFVVTEVSADQLSFKVGSANDYGEITSFSSAGTGTTSVDPDVAARYFHVYREGNNSNLTLRRNKLWGNGTVNGQIKLTAGVNYVLEGNEALSEHAGISVTFSQGVSAFGNRLKFDGRDTVGYRGLNIGVCSGVSTGDNRIVGFGAEGLNIDGSRATCVNDMVQNCAYDTGQSARFQTGHSMLISPIIWNDEQHVPIGNGLSVEATVTNSIVQNARCKNAGTTNANSLVVSSTTNKIIDCIVYDGTFWGEGSATYDPPSLADGAGLTTTVAVTGSTVGMFAEVAFSNNTAGLTVTPNALNGAVAIRFQNETGAAVDLASGTLKVRVRR